MGIPEGRGGRCAGSCSCQRGRGRVTDTGGERRQVRGLLFLPEGAR